MLKKLTNITTSGPVAVVVMDGVGLAPDSPGNAVANAYKPTLDRLFASNPWTKLRAHGTAVGLPSDEDMGNSEVGHNALGSGQVFAQGALLVNQSIASGKLFESQTWHDAVANCTANGSTLHFLGLFSDGNVHSHIDHLKAMITHAKADGVRRVRVHVLLDGRDVGETSALDYVLPFETFMDGLREPDFDVMIASGGGRMRITMDRYEANWQMVEDGWHTHVLGEGRQFADSRSAIEAYRAEFKVIDQDLPPFVIARDGQPVGRIQDGDSVIFFNFRGDRAIEISRAFDEPDFTKFDRRVYPKVYYAAMLEYDGDLHIPKHYLVNPPEISNTLSEYLAGEKICQYAISETQKFGHVTYFWNGNRSGKFDERTETYDEAPSDIIPFEQRPWMQCAQITDKFIAAVNSGKYQFLRTNFPNGDMVGHTGNYRAAQLAVEAVDLCLERVARAVEAAGGVLIVTADHGNADEMYEIDKKTGQPQKSKSGGGFAAKTSHTLNPVPCIVCDYRKGGTPWKLADIDVPGLADVAATVVNFLGYEAPPMWKPSLIEFEK